MVQQQEPVKQEGADSRSVNLMIRGSIAELMGDFPTALMNYQEAQIYDSTSAGIYLAIAQAYQRMGRFESALKVLDQGKGRAPKDLEILENLALLHQVSRNAEKALKTYGELLELRPHNPDYHFRAALLCLQTNRNDDAVKHFEELVKLGQATPEVWRPLGSIYLEQKKYKEARETFEAWIKDAPDDEPAYLAVAQVFRAKDDIAGLEGWYRKTLDENPDFHAVRFELQEFYMAQGNDEAAIQLYQDALEIDAQDMFSVSQLGGLYLQTNDTLKAREMFERLLEMRPDDWRSHFNMGRLNFLSQRWPETVEFLKKATEHDDKIPGVWLLLGQAYAQIDSLEQAESALHRAHKLAPETPETNALLGFVLYQAGKQEDAVPYLEATLKIDPEDLNTLGTLATIYSDLRRYQESDALYEKALAIKPDDPILQNNYSWSLALRGERLDFATELIDKALAAMPDNGAFLDTKGWVLYQSGDYENALIYIKKSLEVRDDSAEVWEHLGDVHEKLGNFEEAISAWQKAFKMDDSRRTLLEKMEQLKND